MWISAHSFMFYDMPIVNKSFCENPIFPPSDKSSDPSNDHFSPDLTGRTNTNMVDQNSLSFLQDICKVSCERKIVFYCWLQG